MLASNTFWYIQLHGRFQEETGKAEISKFVSGGCLISGIR